MLIRVGLALTGAGLMLTPVGLVLICVGLVLIFVDSCPSRLDLCWYSSIRMDSIQPGEKNSGKDSCLKKQKAPRFYKEVIFLVFQESTNVLIYKFSENSS